MNILVMVLMMGLGLMFFHGHGHHKSTPAPVPHATSPDEENSPSNKAHEDSNRLEEPRGAPKTNPEVNGGALSAASAPISE